MAHSIALDHARKSYNECSWHILQFAAGAGLASALPTPTVEIPKQIGIGINDLRLCFSIYKTYYKEDIKTSQQFTDLLKKAGLVTVVGGSLAYVGYKAARGLFDEFANFAPFIGQALSGLLTFSETIVIGFLWLEMVDKMYRTEKGR